MSTDPYTGRNPSYCFVELTTKSQADKALQSLAGQDVLGRPLKLGPGVARSKNQRSTDDAKNKRFPEREVFRRWTRTDAPDHFKGYSGQGQRLWVGGLPEMGMNASVNQGVRELFEGFKMYVRDAEHPPQQLDLLMIYITSEAVSKVIIPRNPPIGDPKARNHRYLFVDFPSAEEASRAAKATDGRYAWGVQIRVRIARDADSRKPLERGQWDEENGGVLLS